MVGASLKKKLRKMQKKTPPPHGTTAGGGHLPLEPHDSTDISPET
jgi:hypothetical protein